LSAKIEKIEVLEVKLPFKRSFKHALCDRYVSDSIFVKVYLKNGLVGYGESLPREYVSDENASSVFTTLQNFVPKKLIGTVFSDFSKSAEHINFLLKPLQSAARCCIEIALLDVLGRYFGKSLSVITGKPIKKTIYSSGVISAGTIPATVKNAFLFKLFGFKSIKVKVGMNNDLKRLQLIRSILGNKIDLRIDANCSWEADEAISNINRMRKFGIKAVEQPLKPDDIDGLKKITENVPEAIVVDESLKTVQDAGKLAKTKACDMFNVRLSKCGGILNALKIIDIAQRNSIRYQLGCQVGETGVLSAAGRHLACGVHNVEYYEGSYGKLLLKEDVTRENMTIGLGGKADCISGPGLGVNVRNEVLDKYTVNRITI